MDTIVPVDQVYGKTLFTQTRVNVRKLPDMNADVLYVSTAGQRVGVVISHVVKNEKTWWEIDLGDLKSGWVQHNPGWYSLKALKEQGAKTSAEVIKEKEQQDKSVLDQMGDFFGPTGTFIKYALPIGIGLVGFMVIDRLIPSKKKSYA